jgi:hypothetical protein
MADTIRCYGVCGGDPKWRNGCLPCSLCGGAGVLAGVKSPTAVKEAYEKVAARGRLSHSAIIAGDVDVPKTRAKKRFSARKPRVSKRKIRAMAREKGMRQARVEWSAWRKSRPEDWGEQLDLLKKMFNKEGKVK